jgi:tRNA uridine 5-carboxymethylaminomethyl modification enzyme
MDEPQRTEVLYRVSYRGYLEREERQIARLATIERVRLPPDLDYAALKGLRRECVDKLGAARPTTLGQASRISGITPSDISILLIHLESRRGRRSPGES